MFLVNDNFTGHDDLFREKPKIFCRMNDRIIAFFLSSILGPPSPEDKRRCVRQKTNPIFFYMLIFPFV